jgi:CheY-like chemotaxis protein
MKPEQRGVLIVDDDPDIVGNVRVLLLIEGYEVYVATTKEEALKMIPSLGRLGIRVALIDGNLGQGAFDGSDGVEINAAIKAEYGNLVKTAGISTMHDIPGADIPRISTTDYWSFVQAVVEL